MPATEIMSNKYDFIRLLLPRQFFKTVGEPKIDLVPMFVFAAVTYIAVFVAFVLLVIDTSGNYINEVTIMSHDQTGINGYTCEMISKVTNTYTTRSDTDPTTSYYLVNIIESQSQCESNLAATDPCSKPQTYIAGDSSPVQYAAGTYFTAVAMYQNDTVYMIDSNGFFLVYNYGNGSLYYSSVPVNYVDTNFVGIDTSGNINYLQRFGSKDCSAVTCVVKTTPTFASQVLWAYNSSYNGIFNDNLYNLYLYDNITLYAVDYSSEVPTHTLLLQLTAQPSTSELSFMSVAVFINETTNVRTIYFSSANVSNGVTSFYMHQDDTTTKLVTPIDAVATTPLVTNGLYLYCPCTLENTYSAICGLNLADAANKGYIDQSFQPISSRTYQSIAISSSDVISNNRMFVTSSADNTHTTGQYFFYQSSFQMEQLANQYNFAAGWFTCGSEIIYPVSSRTSTYPAECSSNGIVGEVLYQEDKKYLFTPTDAASYAIRNSAPFCPALYSQACNTVADLPPYSCSKKVYPTVFTILGTAFANSVVLLSVLLFVCSLTLTYMSKYYATSDKQCGSSRKEERGVSEDDVELGVVSENPINCKD